MTARQSLFFRNNNKGQLVFYPWLYPGRGVIIDPSQRKNITTIIKVFAVSFVIFSIALDLSHHYTALSDTFFVYLKMSISILFPASYFYKMRDIVRELPPQEPTSTARPLIFYLLIFLIFIQALSFITAAHATRIEPLMIPA